MSDLGIVGSRDRGGSDEVDDREKDVPVIYRYAIRAAASLCVSAGVCNTAAVFPRNSFNMSSSLANRRKPRKIGNDDEEDQDGDAAPGTSIRSLAHGKIRSS